MAKVFKGLVLDDAGFRIASGKEYWASRVERLIFEVEDGVLGRPDWGSRMSEFLQEPEDTTLANEIINEISFLFAKREPQLELTSVAVNLVSNESTHGISVEVGVLMPYSDSEDEEQTISFFRILEVG